jgi:uncharacterized protein YqhQ
MADISYGGQAVIEGVMIRSPRYVSVACRLPRPDGLPSDVIDVHTEAVTSAFTTRPWLRRIPLVRGFFALFEMLGIGLRALERSGNLQLVTALIAPWLLLATVDEAGETPSSDGKGQLQGPLMWGTIGGAFVFGLAIFVWLPNVLAQWLANRLGLHEALAKNLIEGGLRLFFFIGYISLISLLPDIRRVFMYHGAEHKVVNGFEAGCELSVDGVSAMSVIHPRCGTNFAFLTIVLSFVVFAFLPWKTPLARLGMRLACLPLVAGLGFELIKLVGAARGNSWVQVLIWPGLALQRLTTRPPTPDMLEVALASFTAVKLAEESGAVTCRQIPGRAAQ